MLPEWLDKNEYPFQHHYFEVSAGIMHYVDEGAGKPIVFLHGNPDWSFSYRKVIKGLKEEYRCIAPDHLGFGLSDKPVNWDHTPETHAKNIRELLLSLDLWKITLVVNDWGGPIGFDFLIRHPERVDQVVIMNTWMWPLNNDSLFWLFSRLMSGKTGQFLTGKFNIFINWLVWLVVYNKKDFTGKIHEHYKKPHNNSEDRQESMHLPKYLMDGKEWFQYLWENRQIFTYKKCLLIWGMKDPAFSKRFLKKWERLLPQTDSIKLNKAGHFPQECQSEKVIKEIKKLLNK